MVCDSGTAPSLPTARRDQWRQFYDVSARANTEVQAAILAGHHCPVDVLRREAPSTNPSLREGAVSNSN